MYEWAKLEYFLIWTDLFILKKISNLIKKRKKKKNSVQLFIYIIQ